jgi:hypothetical protein
MLRLLLTLAFSAVVLASPQAQVCNAMTGSLNCASPQGFLPGVGEGSGSARRSGNLPGMSTLGGDLTGGDRPGTLGAVTFGSGGRKCSGMFRSVDC